MLLLLCLAAGLASSARLSAEPMAAACGAGGDCLVRHGRYRIIMPQGVPGPVGAIMYFHGYQGSAAGTLADAGLVAVAKRLGVALIAPDGMEASWSFPGSPARHRDEFAFVAEVLDDVTTRFAIDPKRILASGFSQGGSMVWSLACRMPERFAGFAPIAGAFWQPLPAACSEPRPPLIHMHGTDDRTVPMAGRSLRSGARQGDLFQSFAVLAPAACTAGWEREVKEGQWRETLTCLAANQCGGGARLTLCVHRGGHFADAEWVERAWLTLVQAQ